MTRYESQSAARDLWPRVDAELRRVVGDATYASWLAPLKPVSLHGDVLRVEAPAETSAWVAERFCRAIAGAAESALGRPLRVEVVDDRARAIDRTQAAPTDHAQIRVPTDFLLHFPVERDPHARANWRGAELRTWAHVGADVECDHVSTPLHLRAMVATAACLQGGIGSDHRVVVTPHELLRAGGLKRAGGRDVLDLLRVLADWNGSTRLRVTLRVPPRARGAWGPKMPKVVIDAPPARGSVVTQQGEILNPATALAAGVSASTVAAIVLDVDARFVRLIASEDACRLVSKSTLQLVGTRELVPYLRHQALAPQSGGFKRRYTAWPWLQQLGMHGRVDPTLETDLDDQVSGAARRTRLKAQRRMEQDLRDDLLKLCEIDRGYSWVRIGDGGNGCSVVRVGVGTDPRTGTRAYGPRPGAAREPRCARRAWRRELVRRGVCEAAPRRFASLARSRSARRAPSFSIADAAWRAPRRRAPQLRGRTAVHGPPDVP